EVVPRRREVGFVGGGVAGGQPPVHLHGVLDGSQGLVGGRRRPAGSGGCSATTRGRVRGRRGWRGGGRRGTAQAASRHSGDPCRDTRTGVKLRKGGSELPWACR